MGHRGRGRFRSISNTRRASKADKLKARERFGFELRAATQVTRELHADFNFGFDADASTVIEESHSTLNLSASFDLGFNEPASSLQVTQNISANLDLGFDNSAALTRSLQIRNIGANFDFGFDDTAAIATTPPLTLSASISFGFDSSSPTLQHTAPPPPPGANFLIVGSTAAPYLHFVADDLTAVAISGDAPASEVRNIAFDPVNKVVVACVLGVGFYIYSLASGAPTYVTNIPISSAYDAVFASDGSVCYLTNNTGVSRYDTSTWTLAANSGNLFSGTVLALALIDDATLAVAGSGGTYHLNLVSASNWASIGAALNNSYDPVSSYKGEWFLGSLYSYAGIGLWDASGALLGSASYTTPSAVRASGARNWGVRPSSGWIDVIGNSSGEKSRTYSVGGDGTMTLRSTQLPISYQATAFATPSDESHVFVGLTGVSGGHSVLQAIPVSGTDSYGSPTDVNLGVTFSSGDYIRSLICTH